MRKTMIDVDKDYFSLIMALNDKAYERISDPEYVCTVPPPEDKCPANLIHTWGIEMVRAGFEMAVELLGGNDENKTD